jgi:short-subunit dehydrogenase
MYTKVLIAGANSHIASLCIPGLNLDNSEVFVVTRDQQSSTFKVAGKDAKNLVIKDYKSSEVLQTLKSFLDCNSEDRLLILNFIGNFGTIDTIEDLDLNNFVYQVNENLIPFLLLAKLITSCQKGLLLSFAGAGVGGDNLETASPSYLASKASIAILVEGLDNQYSNRGIRFGAISPGAFPSKMQAMVAQSMNEKVVSPNRRKQALSTLESRVDPRKLIEMINFLIQNPESAGGRIWSANFDQPSADIENKNFGKLRRVF